MLEALELGFMQNALLAGVLASIACGIIGSLVVAMRMVFVSGGIAHTAYGGVGLAFFFGISPLLGALGFTVAAALVIAFISLSRKHRGDAVIGVIWAVGMALGIILTDLTPGYNADLMSYLFGSILAVPGTDLLAMAGLNVLLICFAVFYYRQLLALCFDEQFAGTRGVPVRGLYIFLMVLTAITVVLLIRVAGLILVIALLTIPPFIAENWCDSLKSVMAWSCVLGMVFNTTGLLLSYLMDISSGPAIIMVAGSCFFINLALAKLRPQS